MTALASLLVAAAVAYLATFPVRQLALRLGVLDVPNERSSHTLPTPRSGGVAIVFGLAAALGLAGLLSAEFELGRLLPALSAAALVAAVSLADDVWTLPALVRFGSHLAAALLLVSQGHLVPELELPAVGAFPLGGAGVVVTLLWLVGLTNVFNFMDGIDGIAAGQAAIAFGFLALLTWLAQDFSLSLASAALAGASLGFLAHNLQPARIFMGDVGSAFLGFAFAALATLAAQPGPGQVGLIVAGLLVGPFLFDSGVTLLRRIARGERWYEAHRSHYYQRLIKLGYSHAHVSFVYYSLALALGVAATIYARADSPWALILPLLACLPLLSLASTVSKLERSRDAVRRRER